MFTKILIANRGEIACRVAATARRLGIRTVAVYSDADVDAQHVQACDEAARLGPAPPADSYLRGDLVIGAALASGAQAVHPGYGFLSENAGFAQACADAGLVFIGPPPSAIEAMGLKAEAKRLMEAAGVPLVPGYHGAAQSPELLKREADRIGYPVLIKASAGGGGKGMRIVAQAGDFDAALASCRREAAASFGNDAVLIERYITRPRHIEIQVFADAHGHCVHLFERDCSVQRRHQKVLEEAPAPGLPASRRAEMGAAAIAAARAVGYVGAGTVEFIAEPVRERTARGEAGGEAGDEKGDNEADEKGDEKADEKGSEADRTARGPGNGGASGGSREGASGAASGRANSVSSGESSGGPSADVRFFFMEMNTRLQVEHPVTEAITGLDLVEWQLRVAAGEPLPWVQNDLHIRGHAIEARICAENPQAGFMPSTGRLDVFRPPAWATSFERGHVRIDAGVREGDTVSPFYDPMIAKLIAWGEDRAQALARLDAALAQTRIVGPHTNVAFLRRVVTSRSFASADLDTALIERERAALFAPPAVALELAVAGVVAHLLAVERSTERSGERSGEGADPWSRRDGWRLHGPAVRAFEWRLDGRPIAAELAQSGFETTLAIGADANARWPFSVTAQADGRHDVRLGDRRVSLHVHATGDRRFTVFAQGGVVTLDGVDPLAASGPDAGPASPGGGLAAPMPGRVVAWRVAAGDRVVQGQPLAVMEAMKMEHTIAAPHDGTVAELLYAVGDAVREGGALLRLTAASTDVATEPPR